MNDDVAVFPGCTDAVVKREVDNRGRVAIGGVPGVEPDCFVRAAVWINPGEDDFRSLTVVSGVVDARQRLDLKPTRIPSDVIDGPVTVAVCEIGKTHSEGEN